MEIPSLGALCAVRLFALGTSEEHLRDAGTPDRTVREAERRVGEQLSEYSASGAFAVTKGRFRRRKRAKRWQRAERCFYPTDENGDGECISASGTRCLRCDTPTSCRKRGWELDVRRATDDDSSIHLRSRRDALTRTFAVCAQCQSACRFRNVVHRRRVYSFNPFCDSEMHLTDARHLALATRGW